MRSTVELGVAVFLTVSLAACTTTPTTPTVWSSAEIRQQMVAMNLNHPSAGATGRLTRWRGPIAVNTNNIARAELALDRVERWSGGLIRFNRVSTTPVNGLTFVEGSALEGDGTPGCVHVTDAPVGQNSFSFTARTDGSGAIVGAYTLHLGSAECDDVRAGRYASAYAEHLLAHPLGIYDHFVGYTGVEGLVDTHAFAVLYNLYANPIGATAQDLVIWPAAPR